MENSRIKQLLSYKLNVLSKVMRSVPGPLLPAWIWALLCLEYSHKDRNCNVIQIYHLVANEKNIIYWSHNITITYGVCVCEL